MNKITSVLGRLACVFTLVALPVALCPTAFADEKLPNGHYKLTGVKVVPIDRTEKGGKTSDEKSDRLTHWIRFDIEARYEVVKGTESQPFKIVNPPVAAKSSITLDKPIKFKGEDVPAGTNLLKYKKFDGSFFNIMLPDPFPLAIHSAIIKQDFALPPDNYTVKFAWTTDQGEVLSETVKVYIDVDLAAKR